MPINDAARAPLPTSCLWQRERSVVVVYIPCFVPLPLISPPLCMCFPQSWPMRSPCGPSAAISFIAEPNMWEDVCWRLCLSRWVPALSLFLFSLFSPASSVLVLSGAVRKMTYVKVLQSRLGPASSCVSVSWCVHVCDTFNKCPKTRLYTEASALWD